MKFLIELVLHHYKVQLVIGLTLVGDADRPPRIAMMSNDGGLLIVDITECDFLHVGTWTVVADVSSLALHGDMDTKINIQPLYIPSDYHRAGDIAIQRRDGTFTSYGDCVFVIGLDGACRVFDSEACIGKGSVCGLLLRGRRPYSETAAGNIRSSSSTMISVTSSNNNNPNTDEYAKALPVDPSTQSTKPSNRSHSNAKVVASTTTSTRYVIITQSIALPV